MEYQLKNSIGFKINQTANKVNNKFNNILQDYKIAPEQRATLEIIKFEKDVNQTKIANILAKDKTTISRTLATLEKKGFIQKEPIDRRTNLIKLTILGEEILNKSQESVQKFREDLFLNLEKEEVNKLIELLEKVNLSVDK
ncbi:MarR family transcriptional regulator [Poseidonibacter lekithochrous]|jgi:DNA-binding MarR family transcriptional regulator|uniref:MarR family winged helix-turn-helix transcriptional regulator n=1 Tax=Poseidonibacter TaxID=2321187 RepID=UPI001C09EB22|nr:MULTISPECIES: MarR family transcriptional regulator [Poseidonibacter]MBU3015272.1 MarR family transcriptional regulator [Poseidonibacter lekithochrous]MDO6828570.1 MarR family transcriptional regulator [Poseidonibacter sp. 1_MG-2023]